MNKRLSTVLAWTPHVLIALFLILASGLPKLLIHTPEFNAFSASIGLSPNKTMLVGVLEIVCAILLLIPRTTTVGFVLLVGLLGGATATGLTHPEVTAVWPWFPLVLILIICIGSYFRSPELMYRIQGKSIPKASKIGRIVAWIFAALIIFLTLFSAYFEFVPPTDAASVAFIAQLGIGNMGVALGITKLILIAIFLYPRTSTWGLILLVGYYAGAMATNITHGFEVKDYIPILVTLVFLAFIAWFRNPELTTRLRTGKA